MSMNLGTPVTELELSHGHYNAAYMALMFPNGIGSKQERIPMRPGVIDVRLFAYTLDVSNWQVGTQSATEQDKGK